MNTTRRQELGLGKTAAGGSGGSFASHERAAAVAPATTAQAPELVDFTVPAQQVRLNKGRPLTWPDGWENHEVSFGEDDSGRFYTSWTFENEDGEQHLIYTDYEDGPDYSAEEASLPYEDDDAMRSIEENIREAHSLMRTNSYRVGRAACERDEQLHQQVRDLSLGGPREPRM